ncbi:hypothetical protein ICN84_11700 [Akkermansia glycaniphila]|uniref:hypothetical protein n=1 Tax=Akkermansia glycaniphila TaxID=1679444 RepID=UPI001C00FEB8|nr:hypothetical protein [Akkermansia glycaniphila]MBT9450731.1 hypothetical protein [Akkermansia glycaniphila]
MIRTISLTLPVFGIFTAAGLAETAPASESAQPETAAEQTPTPNPNPDDERIEKAYTDLIVAFGKLDAILEGTTSKAQADLIAPLFLAMLDQIKTIFAHAAQLSPSPEMMEPIMKVYEPALEKYNQSIDTHIDRILNNKCYGSDAMQKAIGEYFKPARNKP